MVNVESDKIEIRPLLKKEIPEIKKWFDSPFFYFDMPKPTLVSDIELDFFLSYSTSRFCKIERIREVETEAIGLLDFNLMFTNAKVSMEMQFGNYKDWGKIGEIVLYEAIRYAVSHFYFERMEKTVFEFDTGALKLFRESCFECSGKYSSLIYKDGRYWDVYVFTAEKSDLVEEIRRQM